MFQNLFKKKNSNKLVTHNGSFHADDVLACATLQLVLEQRGESYTVTRTRDPKIIAEGDFVFDVGGEYDPDNNRFDHHQTGGAGTYDGEIPYAAIGLVWKKYGAELCGSSEVASMIEGEVVMPVDAVDNGIDISTPVIGDVTPYTFQSICNAFRPTWKETSYTIYDTQFEIMVSYAKEFLKRHILHAQHQLEAREILQDAYRNALDKRLVIIEKSFKREDILPVLTQYKEPLYFVYPNVEGTTWKLEGVRKDMSSFELRKDLPSQWAGLRSVDLQAVTGVSDAEFCHNGLFLAVTKSKKGIMKLATLALKN